MAIVANDCKFKSLHEIGKWYGRAKSSVFKWTQHDSWPCKNGEYDGLLIHDFYETYILPKAERGGASGANGNGELGDELDPVQLLKRVGKPEARLKLQAVMERMLKTRMDREVALHGLISKEDVEQGRIERIRVVTARLRNIRLLALKLEGKTVPEMETILEDWARGTCQAFERGE